MNRDIFNMYIKDLPKNSVRRAAYVVREFSRNDLNADKNCAVTKEEFIEAIDILCAFGYKETVKNDIQIEQYYCSEDCYKNHGMNDFCNGEFSLGGKSKKLCLEYKDSGNI